MNKVNNQKKTWKTTAHLKKENNNNDKDYFGARYKNCYIMSNDQQLNGETYIFLA